LHYKNAFLVQTMPKYIALEWDEHEVRIATASEHGGSAVLERAFAVPLPAREEGKSHDAKTVSAAVRDALAGESLRKAETLAVVGRPSIELKELSLPPAPDDDLPDMVRFQAMRDFTQLSDEAPLDFIPLPIEGEEHRNVLAAAISTDLLREIQTTCTQAGLDLKRLVLRPCAAASLLCRHRPAPGQIRMFVDLLGNEVDLTVLDRDVPVLMRTTRLPGDASLPEFSRPVFLEIRRTIAAVQNKLHGRRVESIYLCGDNSSHQSLAELVRAELEVPIEHFDPFAKFELSADLGRRLPEHGSRYAPLLGMLADAAAGQRHAIDFLDPRRRPVPKTRRREAALIAACAGAAVLAFAGWTWFRLKGMDDEIAGLQERSRSLSASLKGLEKVQKDAAELDKWMVGDIPWLDVLHRVSTQAPKAEDAMLTNVTAITTKEGGKLTLDGRVKDRDKLEELHAKLRADVHVSPGAVNEDDKVKRYKWKFRSDILVDRQRIAQARAAIKAAAKAGGTSGPSDKSGPSGEKKDGEKAANTQKAAEKQSDTTKAAANAASTAAPSGDTTTAAPATSKEAPAGDTAPKATTEPTAVPAAAADSKAEPSGEPSPVPSPSPAPVPTVVPTVPEATAEDKN
jgi:Tfp pilus assembly PilM family ATPase